MHVLGTFNAPVIHVCPTSDRPTTILMTLGMSAVRAVTEA